ncbi:zinc finger BED domain-containing protein RICESLEEPER 2-like [Senna tora]|uniref:Zinc finger BED domain-containing protein RICESLEEPER 2-like n=1 Tax=Senna tora TaxID=362788 RepID=A0A834W5H8_9FABA|nr:zinc finger BED domain-containing protein RICESLEEPER 2-like [Senna tora]
MKGKNGRKYCFQIKALRIGGRCKEGMGFYWLILDVILNGGMGQEELVLKMSVFEDEVEETMDLGEESSSKRSRICTSAVWDKFDKILSQDGSEKAKCKKCGRKYKLGFGTSNFIRHVNKCYGDDNRNVPFVHLPLDQDKYREMVAKLVIKHDCPLSFVEHEGFRDLVNFLNSKAHSISRNTLKAYVLKLYSKEKDHLKHSLSLIPRRISITSDLWSSISTDEYMVVTAHCIDDEWNLHKKVLSFTHVPPPRTGALLAERLYGLLREWGIEKKIFSITLDNASYNDVLVNVLKKHPSLGCSLPCNGNDDLIFRMATNMKVKFDKYWENYCMVLSFAIILDPRYKLQLVEYCFQKIYGSNGESKVLEVRHKLYLLYNEYLSSELSTNHSSLATTYSNSQGQLDATDELQGFDMFESQLFESSRAKSQLDIYLEEKRLCYKQYPDLDVLAFWKSNQHRYNELSLLARDILCILITTVASESSFSIGRRILDKYRSCLLPENVEAILCTQNWLSSKSILHKSEEQEEEALVEDLEQISITG